MGIKENAKNVDTWVRGLFIIVFAVIFYVLYIVIWLLVIFQFFTKVLTGELNGHLAHFSRSLTWYAFQILRYITFQSEERPFPFSPWPQSEDGAVLPGDLEEDAEQAAQARKDRPDDPAT